MSARLLLLAAVLSSLLSLLSSACVVEPELEKGPTPTPYFGNYWGRVTAGGAGVPVGTVVEALNPRGELVGRFVVNTAGYYGYMRVYGEDATAAPPIPGMKAAEAVAFKVDARAAEPQPSPLIWQSSPVPTQIDLVVAASTPSAPPAPPSPGTGLPAAGSSGSATAGR